MKKNEMSLAKFLSRYLLIGGIDLKKLTHEDVKSLFPNIKRSSFKRINQNPNLLYSGRVVLVNDGKSTIPYYIPDELETSNDYIEFVMCETKEYHEEEYYDFMSMTNYELKKLLENKLNSRKNRMKAKKELEDRGLILKRKYKRTKENLNKEDYNGKY